MTSRFEPESLTDGFAYVEPLADIEQPGSTGGSQPAEVMAESVPDRFMVFEDDGVPGFPRGCFLPCRDDRPRSSAPGSGDAGNRHVAQPPEVVSEHHQQLQSYVELLAVEGRDWGLIGPNEDRQLLWERHVLNSLALAPLLPVGSSLLDVGSGAGLPGIPLAIVRPDLACTLLDSKQRRINFLQLAIERLNLAERVRLVRARAEEHRRKYPVVTARAVAPLPKLLDWCLPLLAPGGQLLALKGESATSEIQSAAATLTAWNAQATLLQLPVPTLPVPTWCVTVHLR